MLAKDPFIKMFKEFGSNFKIEHFIHTILYWHQMKTYFIVTKMFSPSNQTEYHYYSATILNPCDQIYLYSRPERIETLGSALKFVIEPLDFCLFLEDPKLIQENIQLERTLVYCIGGQSFQINEVIALFRVLYIYVCVQFLIGWSMDRTVQSEPTCSPTPTICPVSIDSSILVVWWVNQAIDHWFLITIISTLS